MACDVESPQLPHGPGEIRVQVRKKTYILGSHTRSEGAILGKASPDSFKFFFRSPKQA